MMKQPSIIKFPKIGSVNLGYISVSEKETLPFVPKRVYWTYYTPESVERGGHAHFELEQVLIAVAGRIELQIELISGERFNFILDSPDFGVFIPKNSWRTMKYSHNDVQLCIASEEYNEVDYTRDYFEFKNQRK